MMHSAVCAFSVVRFSRSCSTGKERDAESGNDYFGARYYASSMGRFMSPDWSAEQEPVPYAAMDNPQSLNLYAYVMNNPSVRIDDDGHDCEGMEIDACDNNVEGKEYTNGGLGAGNVLSGSDNSSPYTFTINAWAPRGWEPPPGCTSDAECETNNMYLRSILDELRSLNQRYNTSALVLAAVFSKAHGQGERNRAGKASGTGNEKKVNQKARWDPRKQKWIGKDQNGKDKEMGPGFQPTPEQLEKAGLAMAGVATGATAWTVLEDIGIAVAVAF